MLLYDLLTKSSDKQAVENLANTYSLSSDQTSAILRHVLPAMSEAIERNTLSRGGVADFVELLGHNNYQSFLSPETKLDADQTARAGTEALAQIFRTKQQSRVVASRASRATGIPDATIKAMLPAIASIALASLTRQTQDSLATSTEKLVAHPEAAAASLSANPFDALGAAIRGRTGRRRGKRLSTIIRDQLAKIFGFENTGIVSWLAKRVLTVIVRRVVSQVIGRAR